jgi:hypothetical protein
MSMNLSRENISPRRDSIVFSEATNPRELDGTLDRIEEKGWI